MCSFLVSLVSLLSYDVLNVLKDRTRARIIVYFAVELVDGHRKVGVIQGFSLV